MKYDFDTVWNRLGTNSYKWDLKEGELPMWVADMDFKTAPEIIQAMEERAAHGIFGYTVVPEEWYQAYQDWWKERHHFVIEKEWMMFCSGVVPAISSIVRKMTTPGENVLVQTPVYNIFFSSIVNNGRNILENELVYENGKYHMDFGDLEKKLSNPQTTLMLLCNPQNPAGKIWGREELSRIGELCEKHHVLVVADEIHCDLTVPGKEYTPFASVSEACRNNSITCIAPTKTFNIAGIQTAAVFVPNPVIRHKVNRGINTDEVAEPNVFAVTAAVAAFTKGSRWLDELREYIGENIRYVKEFLEKELPQVRLVPSDATYLLWLDCKKVTDNSDELCRSIREETGLVLSGGRAYGECGNGFLRMNIACPKERLVDGCKRLKKGIENLGRQEGEADYEENKNCLYTGFGNG